MVNPCDDLSNYAVDREGAKQIVGIVQILFVISASPITSILSALGQLSTDFSVRPSITAKLGPREHSASKVLRI